MSEAVLLDTCAVIWLMNGDPMSEASLSAIKQAQTGNTGVYVSPITAWEIGALVAKGRLKIVLSVETWFSRLIAPPGVRLAEMGPQILIRSTALPGEAPSDSADRIIIATARELGCPIVTRDRKILSYAADGNVRAIPC